MSKISISEHGGGISADRNNLDNSHEISRKSTSDGGGAELSHVKTSSTRRRACGRGKNTNDGVLAGYGSPNPSDARPSTTNPAAAQGSKTESKRNSTRRGRRRTNRDPSHSGGGGVIREEDTQQKRRRASEDNEDVNPSALHASRPTGGANPQRVRKTSPLGKRFREKTAAGGALHRELRKSKRAFGTRMWRRILGETRLNPSARRVSGPGHEPNQKPTGNPSRTKIRAEIKALNTQRKIPDLEPAQSRCKLEFFSKRSEQRLHPIRGGLHPPSLFLIGTKIGSLLI
jgi:hypothetical protein